MKIRLGYVAISKAIDESTSKTITYTNFIKENKNIDNLNEIPDNNLSALIKILNYNIKNNLHFYRLTSKLIPLATHKDVKYDYLIKHKDKFREISKLIEKNNLRIDLHPDQYAVLNSTNKEVVENTFEILKYHYKILSKLNIKDKIIILHVGSNAFGKENSIKRFINNFNKLPQKIKKCIAVENDDKIFTIEDTLTISNNLDIPIVLDYHHFNCNHTNENIEEFIHQVFSTWKDKTPKIHFSSPKSKLKKEFRSHSDYINVDEFIDFIEKIKFINKDFDIMLEAKAKDDALYRLVRQLKYKTNYKFLDESSFIVK